MNFSVVVQNFFPGLQFSLNWFVFIIIQRKIFITVAENFLRGKSFSITCLSCLPKPGISLIYLLYKEKYLSQWLKIFFKEKASP